MSGIPAPVVLSQFFIHRQSQNWDTPAKKKIQKRTPFFIRTFLCAETSGVRQYVRGRLRARFQKARFQEARDSSRRGNAAPRGTFWVYKLATFQHCKCRGWTGLGSYWDGWLDRWFFYVWEFIWNRLRDGCLNSLIVSIGFVFRVRENRWYLRGVELLQWMFHRLCALMESSYRVVIICGLFDCRLLFDVFIFVKGSFEYWNDIYQWVNVVRLNLFTPKCCSTLIITENCYVKLGQTF